MSAQAASIAEQEERKGEEPIDTPQGYDPTLKLSHNPKMWPDATDDGNTPSDD